MVRPKAGRRSWLTLACALASLSGCEVVVDFEREKLDDQRTIVPTPLPNADGAVAVVPDAAPSDGALIRPDDEEDAGLLDASVRAPDAAVPDAAQAAPVDAGGIDAAQLPPLLDLLDASIAIGLGS